LPVRFLQFDKHSTSPHRKSDQQQHPASEEQVHLPEPIDDMTAKQTTPQVPLINQLRASHATLMAALFSRMVIQQTGPHGEVLEK
jgi:hypothetical protein